MNEEEQFEAWFQQKRRKSWGAGYGHRIGQPVPENWSSAYRSPWREGWMARAALDSGSATAPAEDTK